MSHFYGMIQGQRGDATRMGSKDSGYVAWAQSHQGRVRVNLAHLNGRDVASITIEGGHSAYSVRTRYLPGFDLTLVPAALSVGDPKVEKIWGRICAEFEKLDAEAPKALARAERRERREQLAREREYKARLEREREFAKTVTDAEVEHYIAVALDMDVQERLDADMTDEKARLRIASEDIAPPLRDAEGNLIVAVQRGYHWRAETHYFDLTNGVEVEQEVEA